MPHKEKNEQIIIGKIIAKTIQNIDLSDIETELLKKWLSDSTENQKVYAKCHNIQEQTESYSYLSSIDVRKAFARFQQHTRTENESRRPFIRTRLSRYLAAAGILLVGIFGVYTVYFSNADKVTDEQKTAHIDYGPADNKATVTLSDGRVFNLDEVQNEIVMDHSGINYSDGTLIAETESVVSIKITTPRGGLYNLTLPDGTYVKMNAGSELNYPTVFKGHSREVQFKGEAYFEVASQKNQPFLVHTSDQVITVLGTHFNVEAHEGAYPTKTTLTEGEIRIKENINQAELLLHPGQQAILQNGKLSKRDVNVDQELAWLQGKFNFDGKTLKEVMDDLSRWYNVDVIYEGDVPALDFFGGTFRSSKLSTILSILESNNIQYHMTADNKLIISEKK
ncbi:DUF4974 domain-containing protein [Sphingobacterium phlebotomi]|uniref:DUF4974 domain-containing protein n=1 Tax=Sphingobacterium phlebotomi TaxID=2605433 RepID=A0A5D4H6A1_9SPHI|nr:FecR domain-containing protein [Sphingobacterium phlebotomi]TYR36228.1 DUF4974 domain-containing protein [Sphingobacterium phlebotomi]